MPELKTGKGTGAHIVSLSSSVVLAWPTLVGLGARLDTPERKQDRGKEKCWPHPCLVPHSLERPKMGRILARAEGAVKGSR